MTMSWRTSASSGLDEGDATAALRSSNDALIDSNNKSDPNPGACESTTASSSSAPSSPIGGEEDLESSLVQQQQQQQQQSVDGTSSGELRSSSSSALNMVVGGLDSDDPGGSMIGDPPYANHANMTESIRQYHGGNDSAGDGHVGAPDGDPPSADDGEIENENQDGGSSGSNNNNGSGSSRDKTPKDDAAVDDADGSDHEIPWSPQEDQSVCEFTHIIEDYSHKRDSGCKKAEYSATTVDDRGNRWRLIVYVNGNGRASNHHLSLFLQVRL